MSGIDTIFESVRVYAQTLNHLEDCLLLISTYPYFLCQEDTTVSRIHGAFAKRSKNKKIFSASSLYGSDAERISKARFVMHGLSCCHSHRAGAHAANFITGTVNFQEESSGEHFSDFRYFGGFHPKVLYCKMLFFQLDSLWVG